MKKFALIFLITFFTTITNAQITKGNWMVGGDGYYSNSSFESKTKSNIVTSNSGSYDAAIRPNIGYFFADKLVIGLSTVTGISKTNGNSTAVFSYGGGAFARYYLLKTDKTINILTDISYQYYLNSQTDDKASVFVLKGGPVIFLNSSVALELTLNYGLTNLNSTFGTTTVNNYDFRIGLQIHLEK